ncbi:ATP-binding cassette domain-containing protein [Coxiella endosymbiont of Dermacentor marginatus]|uniref:hypothetical protein n=1 Tax=Coxiella endosymbiont of Dermacentor marginatus TaxID=1656159 RepID=UPI0022230462|nr:hypothetical protein [Coxiella endosymbiont of Dermacentor marginatus]
MSLKLSDLLDPALILYDAPFSGQAPINRSILSKLIHEFLRYITSILVSRDFMEVTTIADYIDIIAGGKIIGSGALQIMKTTQDSQI